MIHSFWVPALNRKIDTIPGERNRILLYADRTGVYRGECAEYCGLQHAHMAMHRLRPDAGRLPRLARERGGERAAAGDRAAAQAGRTVFLNGPCSSCHTIRGTSASGYLGPDLTHLASRTTLAGVTIPNRKGYLAQLDHRLAAHQAGQPDAGHHTSPARSCRPSLAYLESLK